MRRYIHYFFKIASILLLLLPSGSKAADTTSFILVKELSDDWLVFDKEYNTYFPVLTTDLKNIKSATQLIDLQKYKGYQLQFRSTKGLTLFVENELVYEDDGKAETIKNLSISEFPRVSRNEKDALTFYNSWGNLPFGEIKIVKPGIYKGINQTTASIFPRTFSSLGTLYTLVFLFILSGIAVVKNRFSKRFYEFLGVSSIFPTMEENPIWDITSVPVLLLLLINSLCSALIIFVIKREFDLDSLNILNIFSHQAVLGILSTSIVIFILYLVKYFQLKITGWLFNLEGIVKIQFFELMKVSLKVNLFLSGIILFFYSAGYFKLDIGFSFFFYFVIFTLLIVLLRVGYLIFAYSRFRNIYLFSYLCATEILPLVIIVKLILF